MFRFRILCWTFKSEASHRRYYSKWKFWWKANEEEKKINVIVEKREGGEQVYYVRANNGLTMGEKKGETETDIRKYKINNIRTIKMLLTVGNFFFSSLSSNCRISRNEETEQKRKLFLFFHLFPSASWWCFNVVSIGIWNRILVWWDASNTFLGRFMLIDDGSEHPLESDACPQMP